MIRKEKRSNESILSEIKNLLFSPSFSKKIFGWVMVCGVVKGSQGVKAPIIY